MRRYVLIALGSVAIVWGALALALGSASLKLGFGSAAAKTSPSCLPATLTRTALLPGTTVAVSPAPGSVSANPHTQISFLGSKDVGQVAVVGQRSGEHRGRVVSFSQADGASFLPDAPFAPGERVTVRAVVGAKPVSFGFRVDHPYPTDRVPEFPAPPAAGADYQSFYTLPGVQAPVMHVTTADRDPAAGDVFTTNGPGPGQYGALIYSPQGRLVWFDRLQGGETAENLDVQSYRGRRVLTLWQGRVLSLGFGQGEDVVMNSRYQTIARVAAGNGLQADLHDFRLAGGDVAYVTAYAPILCDLRPVGGARDGTIVDNAIQAIDMKTGLVRWEWHSLDHVGAGESEVEASTDATPWDYFHLNSVDVLANGELLVSARSTWAGYELDGASGAILWRLGGNHSTFAMGAGTKMAWQHDGRVLPDGEVTFFDDGANPPIHSQSRGLRIRLDLRRRRATLVASYVHRNPPLLAASQGNLQTLPDGNSVIGYGGVPAISEYARDGTLLFDAHQPYDTAFYRAFRYPWHAIPATPPAVLASANNTEEGTIVYASWNGATDVASWRVLAGESPGALKAQATMGAVEFESATTLAHKFAYVAVQALSSSGRVLGTSPTARTVGFYASLTQAASR